jgi:hypothetical protein
MDHSLSVGHLGAILKLGLLVPANHLVNLLMDPGWGKKNNIFRMIVQKCTVDARHGTMFDRHIAHSQQTLAVGIVGTGSG